MPNDAIAESVRAGAPAETTALEQMALLPELEGHSRAEEVIASAGKRGRPKGARNLATREVVEFIRRTIGDPLVESARWLLLTPAELGKALGCTAVEAWDRQQRVREHLSRFMHAPLAPIDGQGHAVVPRLTVHFGGQHAHVAGAAGRPPWEYDGEQIQALTVEPEPVSHGNQSHDDGNLNDHNDIGSQSS